MEFIKKAAAVFFAFFIIFGVSAFPVFADVREQIQEVILKNFIPQFTVVKEILEIGIPAVLSLYFDLFSGLLQAYIFAMLTMLYISGGFPAELFNKKKIKKI